MSAQDVVPAGPASSALAMWNAEQLQILKRDLGIKSDADLAYFHTVCQHKGLDPFLNEIVPVYYGGELTIQETVEGLRSIAERSGLYGGFKGPEWCGPDMVWREVWLPETPPAAARYFVIRKDWGDPVPGVARWASSVQLDRYGKPMPLWKTRPDEMLGKTAEVRALKRAFNKWFARAGVNVRDLTDAQRITIDARLAGLDDEARHALVAEITDGRTDSTREVTDEETLALRAELARRRAETEPDDTPPPPDGDEPQDDYDRDPGQSAEAQRRRLIANLAVRVRALTGDQKAEFYAFEEAAGIGLDTRANDLGTDQLAAIQRWLDEHHPEPGTEAF